MSVMRMWREVSDRREQIREAVGTLCRRDDGDSHLWRWGTSVCVWRVWGKRVRGNGAHCGPQLSEQVLGKNK